MIVVNEDHEKQDIYSGPTIRLPERVARRRRSLSPLPDYEASEEQYRQSISFDRKDKRAWHQTKIWRAILFLLLTYALLTTVIGVPIIVKKMKGAPDEDSWDPGFFGNQQFSSSAGVISYQGNQPCNTWTTTDFVHSLRPYSATLRIQIPATGDISIRSNATLEDTLPTNIFGTFTAEYDSDIKDNNVHLTVNMQTTSLALRESTLVCYDNVGEDRGLSIFIPRNVTNMDSISMDIHVAFPPSASTGVSNFNVYLPVFTQVYKELSQINFQSVIIEGISQPINVTNVQAPCISVKNMLGDISGKFNASESLLLDTIRGAINASITLVKDSTRTSPTQMTLDTGDRNIDAEITLLSPGRFSSSPQFMGRINNFNAEVNVAIGNDPSTPPLPIYISVQNNLAPSRVVMDQNFEGTFLTQTKLDTVSVTEGGDNYDIFGSSRKRTLLFDQPKSSSRMSGWVGWGKKPDSNIGQSRIEITSSLGPVELEFAPT